MWPSSGVDENERIKKRKNHSHRHIEPRTDKSAESSRIGLKKKISLRRSFPIEEKMITKEVYRLTIENTIAKGCYGKL